MNKQYFFLVILFLGFSLRLVAQCPSPVLYDVTLANTDTDQTWVNCIDSPLNLDEYDFNLVSPNDIVDYTIDFGDGSPIVSRALLSANTPLVHKYTRLGTFTVTLTSTENGCTTTIGGTVINDRKPGAAALPPTLGSSGCVPHSLTFSNQTTNVSEFTTFIWDWGNGEYDTLNHTTAGQNISHTYLKGMAGCDMTVKITAQSECATSFSEYGPYNFWDIDTAVVAASETQICAGEEITFTDVSIYNCNITQARKIRWNFTDVGGTVTPWLAAIGNNRTESFQIDGNVGDVFTVTLADSNFCGVDLASVNVTIVAPPTAIIAPIDDICAGNIATFENNSNEGTNFIWDFGDGTSTAVTSTENVTHTYATEGTYTVQLIARNGAIECSDTTSIDVTVLRSSISDFNVNNEEGCGSLDVVFTENSSNDPILWEWDLGIFGTYNTTDIAPLSITQEGVYDISLRTENAIGCGTTIRKTLTVFPEINIDLLAEDVCLGDSMLFLNQSSLPSIPCATGEITYERWDDISGNNISKLTESNDFQNDPADFTLSLSSFESPSKQRNNFGARIKGFICPPLTGNYTFYIASDDHSELYLGPNGNPDDKQRIAYVNSSTNPRQWTKFITQESASIFLIAGQRYYIEALHKEGGGNDHLAVGWTMPDGTNERPISGARLSPYQEGHAFESFTWDFGDGSPISTENTPKHLYNSAGTYTVNFTASTGACQANENFTVFVNELPNANFTVSEIEGCTPLSISTYNQSSGASNYIWNWNDGSAQDFSTQPDDTLRHVYFNASDTNQIYTIQLVAVADAGCSDTLEQNITVFHGPIANFTFDPSTPQCSPVEITFKNNSIGATDFNWLLGDETFTTQSTDSLVRTFTNKTGGITYDTLSLEASSGDGCVGKISKILVVYPEPDFEIISVPDSGCSPLETSLFATGSPVNFLWNFGDGISSTRSTPKHTFTNTLQKDTVFTVELIASTFFNCKDTVYKEVKVFPKPIHSFTQDENLGCSPLEVNFTNESIGSDYIIWNFGETDIESDSIQLSYTFSHTGIAPKTNTIESIAMTNNGCSDTIISSVVVYPSVVAQFAVSDSIGCSPLTIQFENQSTGNNQSSWNFGNGISSLNENSNQSFTNTSTTSDTLLTELIVTSTYNCTDTAYQTLIIHHEPEARLSLSNTIGCSPLTIEVENNSLRNDFSKWGLGDTTYTVDNNEAQSYTFYNETFESKEYLISLSSTTEEGCSSEEETSITLFPQIEANISTEDTVGCSPLIAGFSNTSTNASKHTWLFGDGQSSVLKQPTHVFYNESKQDTTFEIQYIAESSFGCRDTSDLVVSVLYQPIASFTTNETQGCSPLSIYFSNESDINTTALWTFENDSIITTQDSIVSFIYYNDGISPVTDIPSLKVTASNGCADSINASISIYPSIKASISTEDTVGCSPFSVQFENQSERISSHTWLFGDGESSILENPQHLFNNNSTKDSTYTIQYIAESNLGCTDTTYLSIDVLYQPVASFSKDITQGCAPLNVTFSNNSEIENNTFMWFLEDSILSSQDTIVSFNFLNDSSDLAIVYPALKVIAPNGCSDSTSTSLTIYPTVSASFEMSDTMQCSPFKLSLNNTSKNGFSYLWFSGAGQAGINEDAEFSYSNFNLKDTSFTVQLIATSLYNCKDTIQQSIDVLPEPLAEFSINQNQGCSPLITNINNNTAGNHLATWSINDSTFIQNDSVFAFTFLNESTNVDSIYQNTLIVENDFGCKDTTSQSLRVYPITKASFSVDSTTGCSPLTVNFKDQSENALTKLWEFGNGSFSVNSSPSNTFQNFSIEDTTYIVKLVTLSQNGCADTLRDSITVYPNPIPSFLLQTPSILVSDSLKVENLTIGNWSYHWDLGNGVEQQDSLPPNAYYTTDGTYTITLTAFNDTTGCSNSQAQQVEVILVAPEASFIGQGEGCGSVTIDFENTSTDANTFEWSWGDGQSQTVDNQGNVRHTFVNTGDSPITYNVTLKAIGEGGTNFITKQDSVLVYPLPSLAFTPKPDTIYLPGEILFNNLSTGAIDYLWDFGDGNISSEINPKHEYTEEGNYTVTLIGTTADGCIDTLSVDEVVFAQYGGLIKMPNAFTPSNAGPTGGNINIGGLNDVFAPAYSHGVEEYQMQIFNQWGELIFETSDLEIGWDGYYRGELMPEDVYLYKINAEMADGTSEQIVGTVTLIVE